MKFLLIPALALGTTVAALGAGAVSHPAQARGCIKGAAVGGVAGHYAGHHAILGAVGGCIVGRHMANVHDREAREAERQGVPPGGVNYDNGTPAPNRY